MSSIQLSKRDIDFIARVVETEVPRSIAKRNPKTYNDMVKAVTDTIVNRVASPSFPDTVEGVVNQNRQFSKIAGPQSYRAKNGKRIALNPYGKVDKAPKASELVQSTVQEHIQARVAGEPSTVGGALHYANPAYSSPSNQKWIRELDGPRLGVGSAVHHHGTAPGFEPAPEYTLQAEGVSPATQMAQADLPTPRDRPQAGLLASAQEPFDQGGILNPAQAGSFSPVSQAAASDLSSLGPQAMPNAQPRMTNPADSINQAGLLSMPQGAPSVPVAAMAQPEMSMPDPMELMQQPQAPMVQTQAPANAQQGLPDDQFNQRFAGLLADPAPQQAQPMGTSLLDGYTQMAQTMDAAGVQGLGATTTLPGATPTSVLPPQQPMQAPMQQPMAQPMQAPAPMQAQPMPAFNQDNPFGVEMASQPVTRNSAMDVYRGQAQQGFASDGSEIFRSGGDMYRYNPEFDHTQRIGQDGAAIGGVMQGRVEGPIGGNGGGFGMPSFGGIGNTLSGRGPRPQSGMGGMARSLGGSMAGAAVGGFLGGPVGGLLGGYLGRNMATGNGLLGGRNNLMNQLEVQSRSASTQPFAASYQSGLAYPDAPERSGRNRAGFGSEEQYESAARISRATADAIERGQGGLF